MKPNRSAMITAATLAVLLAGCTGTGAPVAGSSTVAGMETIAEGLDAPWSVAFDGASTVISERDTARIVEVDDDGAVREVAVIEGVVSGGEGGLLGIAVQDGFLYAYSTASDGNRVQRFALSGSAGDLRIGEAESIIAGIPSAANHNGGRIAFGPDRMLYVTTGDAGERDRAQDTDSLAGKILRLTPDGAVPEDNPFPGSPVYSYGHRNPQGLAWTPDGTLFASEFGQDTWDELNIIEPGGNYGWPVVEGIVGRDGFIDPVQQWAPGVASPSGIAVSGGSVFVANLRGERVRAVPLDDTGSASELLVGDAGRVRDVVLASDGTLWVLTNNTDGRGSPREGDDRLIRLRTH